MEELVKKLEKEIEEIKIRNQKVEKEKAWETSRTRKVSIACTTYLFISLVLFMLGNENPFLNAIIPVIGYSLSTLSISLIKQRWLQNLK